MTLFELYQSASTATLTNIEQEVQSIQLNNRWNVSGLTLACLYEATPPLKTENCKVKPKICWGNIQQAVNDIPSIQITFPCMETLWIEKAIESVVIAKMVEGRVEVGKWEETPAWTVWWSVGGDWTWVERQEIEVHGLAQYVVGMLGCCITLT